MAGASEQDTSRREQLKRAMILKNLREAGEVALSTGNWDRLLEISEQILHLEPEDPTALDWKEQATVAIEVWQELFSEGAKVPKRGRRGPEWKRWLVILPVLAVIIVGTLIALRSVPAISGREAAPSSRVQVGTPAGTVQPASTKSFLPTPSMTLPPSSTPSTGAGISATVTVSLTSPLAVTITHTPTRLKVSPTATQTRASTPTRTPTATRTSTPRPAVTFTPTRPRPSPTPTLASIPASFGIIAPPDGAVFLGRGAVITLQWQAVKPSLAPNEYYIAVLSYPHDVAVWYDYQWTQSTSVVLPAYLFDLVTGDRIFRWTVGLVRLESGEPTGDPTGRVSIITNAGEIRTFQWAGEGGGGGGGGSQPKPTWTPRPLTYP